MDIAVRVAKGLAMCENRKGLPKEIKKPNFSKKSTVAYRQNNTLVLGWEDKRVVTCLTTAGDTGMTTVKRITRGGVNIMVKKPNIVVNYIKNMGGVDRADQYASTYCFLRKSLKWWRKCMKDIENLSKHKSNRANGKILLFVKPVRLKSDVTADKNQWDCG
ncbi:hypothetical protein M0802_007112 [Mischocyttarus mexicanus]|nr:hypothetical protein M0802_007112 [Mischocyttarus mexicanus]